MARRATVLSDIDAFAAVRALALLAAGVVVVRGLSGVRGERIVARTGWQYIWVLYAVDYAILLRHPLPTLTPSWYDALVRPLGLALMVAGIVVVGWAYATMGGYWSGAISARADHRVIAEGPFAFVRHPVYAAFLLGVIGGALALADPVAAVTALVSIPLMRGRALAEERFLEDRLGDAYRDYRKRVSMFVPGVF
ncbi:MAG: isoprenylcysteine carboxylmethyltransferase family protein [Chloroflexi bacterium]|nr:MAG: isoprenylcysteine carboxylmethyltransferase family protein [Chloroflexota bacterium]